MKYRKVGNALDPAFRNDLNVNFKDIDEDIKKLQGIATENKNELLSEIERVEEESIERDNFLAGTNVDEFIQSINDTKDLALQAASNANVKAQLADDKANYAEQMGDYAKEQGDYAKAKGEYADEKALLADEKATLAQQEIDTLGQLKIEVTDAKQQALQATESANTQASHAEQMGNYAEQMGDYAKQQGDAVQDIIDQGGTVASVNGKTGTVVLDANDVGAIPEAEKGQANGVARLNEEGKVVDAHGNEVEGKVRSVNGKTGDIVLTSNDIGAVSQDDFEELETEVNNNTTEISNLQDDLNTHKAESVNDGVHGMGSIASQEYEEGVWTPTLHFGGNNDGMTYAYQLGKYVRTGNLVYFEMQIVLTYKGSSVGNATIAGLPFAAAGSPTRSFIISDVLNFPIRNNEYIMARLSSGSVMNLIYTSDMSNATLTITEADFSDDTRIILSGHYRI